MDEFITEMHESLDEIKKADEQARLSSSSFFAEALIPGNPNYWPAHMLGSSIYDESPDLKDRMSRPIENLKGIEFYLETSQSDVQYRDRLWKVKRDTAIVNALCEYGGHPGAVVSGRLANMYADQYVDEQMETRISLTKEEEINLAIFKDVAINQNIDPEVVVGTGLFRQFVPEYMKNDLCNRPDRLERPSTALEDGILTGTDVDGVDSILEFSSNSNIFHRMCSLFGFSSGSHEDFGGVQPGVVEPNDICPASSEGLEYDFLERLCAIFGPLIPETGGVYHVTDPTQLAPPPFVQDYSDLIDP